MGKLTLLLWLFWSGYSIRCGWVRTGLHDYTASMMMWRHSKLQTRNLKRETINFLPKLAIVMAAREALEERARNKVGMTRPGETFYRLVPDVEDAHSILRQNDQ